MKYILEIPKPCSENWNEMSPTDKGKFCTSCQKEVLDFTHSSDADIVRFLNGNNLHCGKFSPSQLNREIATANIKSQSRFSWFLGLTSLFFANSALAQEVKPSTEIVENKNSLDRQDSAQWIEIKGTVSDEYGPMGGVVVMEKGTENGTVADDSGAFSIKIPIEKFQNKVYLVFKSFGFEAKEFEVFNYTKNRDCEFDSESNSYISGSAGGVMLVKQTFFRRMTKPFRVTWWKMKRKFHKN